MKKKYPVKKQQKKWNDKKPTMPNINMTEFKQLASYICSPRSCIHATQFNGCK